MDTKIFRTDQAKEAARILTSGGLLVFPTETVYGLGASLQHPEALGKIYTAKGRPSDNPLILHLWNREMVSEVVGELTKEVQGQLGALMEAFWPGPLTLVLPKSAKVPDIVTAGLPTVAVRMPSSPLALTLLEETIFPVAAPSANLSGRPSPTTFSMAQEDMMGRVEGMLQGPDCEKGLESTILSLIDGALQILRPGSITPEEIREVLGLAADYALLPRSPLDIKALAPGMIHRHYQPKARVVLFRSTRDLENLSYQERRIKAIALKDTFLPEGIETISVRDWEEYGRILFRSFSQCDQEGIDLILAQAPEGEEGIGAAVLNRLLKASGGDFAGEGSL
jgi:L-threonylcarbamoyladenylate synthase